MYVTGGYAFLESERQFSGPVTDFVSDFTVDFEGWAAGAGVETRLATRMSLKAELIYHEFEDEPTVVDEEFFSARVGLNWHF